MQVQILGNFAPISIQLGGKSTTKTISTKQTRVNDGIWESSLRYPVRWLVSYLPLLRRMPKMRRVDGEGLNSDSGFQYFHFYRDQNESAIDPDFVHTSGLASHFRFPRGVSPCFDFHSFSSSIKQPQPCASLPSSPSSAAPPPSPPPPREFSLSSCRLFGVGLVDSVGICWRGDGSCSSPLR